MIPRFQTFLGRILRDEQGATLVEFAIVAPVLCLLIMGLFDLGFQTYSQSTLQGAVQEAARSSTLEPGSITYAMMDADVTAAVHDVIPGAEVTFTRKNYQNFADIQTPEEFTDTNGNDQCDEGEPFEDLNGNGSWDLDRGAEGAGGARDAVLYSATATYDRLFPLHSFIGVPQEVTIGANTVLRNQPFDEQKQRKSVVGTCV